MGKYKWLKLIAATKKEEMEMLAVKKPELERVYSRIIELSADETERMFAEAREKARRDEAARLSYALDEGFEKGMEKGMAKGMEAGMAKGMETGKQKALFEMARQMLERGYAPDEISSITSVSLSELQLLASDPK